ncbi:unnamed protein product, partial [Closterium sp. NIES-54]
EVLALEVGLEHRTSSCHSRDSYSSRDSRCSKCSGRCSSSSSSGVLRRSGALRSSADLVVRRELAAAAALPAGGLVPLAATLAPATTGSGRVWAVPLPADAPTTLHRAASAGLTTSSIGDTALRHAPRAGQRYLLIRLILGACVVTSPFVPMADASLSFTLDSGASKCFFHDHITVTPLPAPVSLALADPTSGPAVAHSSTTLPCQAVC